MVEVARGSRPRRVCAARDDPDAGNERDAGPDGIDRELPRLVVEVARVVVAVPAPVLLDAAFDRGYELAGTVRVGIEIDDEVVRESSPEPGFEVGCHSTGAAADDEQAAGRCGGLHRAQWWLPSRRTQRAQAKE